MPNRNFNIHLLMCGLLEQQKLKQTPKKVRLTGEKQMASSQFGNWP